MGEVRSINALASTRFVEVAKAKMLRSMGYYIPE